MFLLHHLPSDWLCFILSTGRPQIYGIVKKNLALLKKAIASSTDKGLAKFVMDGDPRTCFMSHAEKNPWLIVFIGGFQRASLIRIHSAESKDNITNLKGVGVSAGMRSPALVIFLSSKPFW